MIETINQILDFLIKNYSLYMVVTMGGIITITIALLSLIKKPIKALTKKIPNEKARKLSNNIVCITLAFLLSATCWYALSLASAKYFSCNEIEALLTGAFSVVLYAVGDGVITRSSAKHIVEEIIEDSNEIATHTDTTIKKTKTESAVKEFLKRVK